MKEELNKIDAMKLEKTEPIELNDATDSLDSKPCIKNETSQIIKKENNQGQPKKQKKTPKIVNKDVCAICLSNFRTQSTGTPEVCNHQFCFDCIEEWAKVF